MRVRNLVPEEVWERRYQHINDFERMLADEGTTIVKFYLHISRDEQTARLQSRQGDGQAAAALGSNRSIDALELRTGEALAFADLARRLGDSDLENVLGQIHGDQ